MMKRILALILTCALLLGLMPAAAYTEVQSEDELVEAVVFLQEPAEAEVGERGTETAERQREEILREQQRVLGNMDAAGVPYTLLYRYTALLNGFAVELRHSELERVRRMPEVADVCVSESYMPIQEEELRPSLFSVSAESHTGNLAAIQAGYDGEGLVIAVLDTGINTSHEAFQNDGDLCNGNAALTEAICKERTDTAGRYLNAKIPFAYNYADQTDDVWDTVGHGTHVAGLCAGYAAAEDGAVLFRGASPAAQLLVMKVFGRYGSSDAVRLAALNDAYLLGADVINMSYGVPNGFVEPYGRKEMEEAYNRISQLLKESGIISCVSVGNSGSMADIARNGYIRGDYTDYGTAASPAVWQGNVSVAAMENCTFPVPHIAVDGKEYGYYDAGGTAGTPVWSEVFAGKTMEFVLLPDGRGGISTGVDEDYETVDTAGKLVVVKRGEISFYDKAVMAVRHGAAGLIVCNTVPGELHMQISPYQLPAISVPMSMERVFLNAESNTVYTGDILRETENPEALRISQFSSWGTSPSLTLDPMLTSFGGNLYSAEKGGESAYGLRSGTSMSAPILCGTFTDVLSFLKNRTAMEKRDRAVAAEELLESSARILTDQRGVPYSVRRQGAGLAVSMPAVRTYEEIGYIASPLKELGDDPGMTGEYKFDVCFKNTGDRPVVYAAPAADVLTDRVVERQEETVNTMTSYRLSPDVRCACEGSEVTEIHVPAGGTAVVQVSIRLSQEDRNYLAQFSNGAFVEGFVRFTAYRDGGEAFENHATFLAYYGDWTKAPVLEEKDFRDWLRDRAETENSVYTVWNDCRIAPSVWAEGKRPGENTVCSRFGAESVPFDERYVSFSPKGGNRIWLMPSLLRNAEYLTMEVTGDENTHYALIRADHVSKNQYDKKQDSRRRETPFSWDGTYEKRTLPSGTTACVRFHGVLPYGKTEVEDVWSFAIRIDSIAPEIESVSYDGGTKVLTVTAADEQYLQGIYVTDPEGNVLGAIAFAPEAEGEICTARFDTASWSEVSSLTIHALDYAENETETVLHETVGGTGEHVHQWELTEEIPATCTEYGSKTYICSCGESRTELLPPLGHLWDISVTREPTCTEEGERSYTCSRCQTRKTESIPAAHSWDGGRITKEPKSHENGEKTYTCTKCGEIRKVILPASDGHMWENGEIVHRWNEGVVTRAPEDTEMGEITYTCTCCGETRTELLPHRNDHCWDQGVVLKRPTHFRTGEMLYTCTVPGCGAVKIVELPRLESHEGGSWYPDYYPRPVQPHGNEQSGESEPSDEPLGFTDVDAGAYYYDSVLWAVGEHVTTGVDGTHFAPDAACTRGEAVTFLWRALGSPEPKTGCCPFADVLPEDYFYKAVLWAWEQGIVNGVATDTFAPHRICNRGGIVTMLWRANGAPSEGVQSFWDVPEGAYYAEAVCWAVQRGITGGMGNGTFSPEKSCTRGQIVTFLFRTR